MTTDFSATLAKPLPPAPTDQNSPFLTHRYVPLADRPTLCVLPRTLADLATLPAVDRQIRTIRKPTHPTHLGHSFRAKPTRLTRPFTPFHDEPCQYPDHAFLTNNRLFTSSRITDHPTYGKPVLVGPCGRLFLPRQPDRSIPHSATDEPTHHNTVDYCQPPRERLASTTRHYRLALSPHGTFRRRAHLKPTIPLTPTPLYYDFVHQAEDDVVGAACGAFVATLIVTKITKKYVFNTEPIPFLQTLKHLKLTLRSIQQRWVGGVEDADD